MLASSTQDQVAYDVLTSIIENRESYSPAGLATEVVRAIEAEHPQFGGVLSHIANGLLCREDGRTPSIKSILDGYVLPVGPFSLPEHVAKIEADPTNRLIAAARKLSEAREEAMYAQVACVQLEDELQLAAAQLLA